MTKPCPFCGSEIFMDVDSEGGGVSFEHVADGCILGYFELDLSVITPDNWEEKWNGRPKEEALAKQIKELRESIYGLKSILVPLGDYSLRRNDGKACRLTDLELISETIERLNDALDNSETTE